MVDARQSEERPARLGWADGLRGLAALAILGYEILRYAPGIRWPNELLQRAAFASMHGFDALLVLSGLLLALPVLTVLRREGSADFNVARYALGRALRILPAYYFVLAAAVLIPLGAATYNVGGLPHAGPAGPAAWLQAVFAGTGLGNDGLAAAAAQIRVLALLPVLVGVYVFAPATIGALCGLALFVDYTTPAHHWDAGAIVPLVAGIVAADVLARGLRVERIAWFVAALAAVGAFVLEPIVGRLPQPQADPGFVLWNPLWAVAAAALAVACSQRPAVGRVLGGAGFRQLGAASYAIVLLADPICSFALHRASPGSGSAAILGAAGMTLAAATGLWLVLDRFAASDAMRRVADVAARPFYDAWVIALGAPRARRAQRATVAPEQSAEERFGPLPTMHPGMLASVAQRIGSFEDLRAEIEAAKRRLAEAASHDALYYDTGEYVTEPDQLVLARDGEEQAERPSPVERERPLEGVLLSPMAAVNPRKVVSMALGANHPQRSTVRVRFGPKLDSARAS
jgi:peptidoglycan/LPS O-acetylase OafA/YrhL